MLSENTVQVAQISPIGWFILSPHTLSIPPCSKLGLFPSIPGTCLCCHSRNFLCFLILLELMSFMLYSYVDETYSSEISCKVVQSNFSFFVWFQMPDNVLICSHLIYNGAGYKILSWKTFLSEFWRYCYCPPASSFVEKTNINSDFLFLFLVNFRIFCLPWVFLNLKEMHLNMCLFWFIVLGLLNLFNVKLHLSWFWKILSAPHPPRFTHIPPFFRKCRSYCAKLIIKHFHFTVFF